MKYSRTIVPSVVVLLALIAVSVLASGCTDARGELAAANRTKDTLNETLYSAIKTGVYEPTPEQAAVWAAASRAISQALDDAEAFVNEDGSGKPGFDDALLIVKGALARFRLELRQAGLLS